jgi:hypothetical protein
MKKIICFFKGHSLGKELIGKTINPNNWCRKCTRCGKYILHGDIGSIAISEKEAMDFKRYYEKEMKIINTEKFDSKNNGGVK